MSTPSTAPAKQPTHYVPTLDFLRGVASLGVCWWHIIKWNESYLSNEFIKASAPYGALGVYSFFVISGFVIPWSLHHAKYHLNRYPKFIIKRVTRLDPPYFASILLFILIGFGATFVPAFSGGAFHVDLKSLVLHVGYLNAICGEQWINPVYWSLAIEFQYYLLMGLIYPLLRNARFHAEKIFLLFLCGLSIVIPNESLIFRYLPLFAIGIIVYWRMTSQASKGSAVLLGVCVSTILFITLGIKIAAVGVATGLIIVLFRIASPVFYYLGLISYSLYLIHTPIGPRVIRLGMRFSTNSLTEVIVVIGAVATCLLCAAVFYYLVEKPSQRLSSKFKTTPKHKIETVEIPTSISVTNDPSSITVGAVN